MPDAIDIRLTEQALGWVQQPTSCGCGGNVAWWRQLPSGGEVCAGCVCHRTPFRVDPVWEAAHA